MKDIAFVIIKIAGYAMLILNFQDVTANEFNSLMELLGTTRLGKTISGHQELVDLVAEQVELDQPFSPGVDEETELLDRLINCVRYALPYFSVSI